MIYCFVQVTPQVVLCLTDVQLAELGVSTIGDRTSLRQRCQRLSRGIAGLILRSYLDTVQELHFTLSILISSYKLKQTLLPTVLLLSSHGKHMVGVYYILPSTFHVHQLL